MVKLYLAHDPGPRRAGFHTSFLRMQRSRRAGLASAGFWPGDRGREPAFYAYAYPAPPGFDAATVEPAEARWDAALGEFILPYAAVRIAADPDAALGPSCKPPIRRPLTWGAGIARRWSARRDGRVIRDGWADAAEALLPGEPLHRRQGGLGRVLDHRQLLGAVAQGADDGGRIGLEPEHV